MSISSVGSGAALEQQYSIAVAKKQLDAQAVEGQSAVELIQSAETPPLKPGHRLSVVL